MTAPLVLTAVDSHISYSGGELTAAIDVLPSDWSLKGNIATLALPAGATDVGRLDSVAHLQLLVEVGRVWKPMHLARWPNIPFDRPDAEVPPVNWTTVGSVSSNCSNDAMQCNSFGFGPDTHAGFLGIDRPLRWVTAAKEGRLFLQGFFKYLWRDGRAQINKVDVAQQLLVTDAPTISASGVFPSSPYFAYGNLHEELDVPGEYATDNRTGFLSAILPRMCVSGRAVVCRTRLVPAASGNLVTVTGANSISLSGVNITGSAGVGVVVLGSSNVKMDRCKFNALQTGVTVSTSSDVSLTHSEVGWTLMSSTSWSGGNRTTLTSARLLVSDSIFHDFGTWQYTYQAGVHVDGVGVIVRKNLFYASYHVALLFSGNEHMFELNEMRNVATIGYDTGAVYAGRDLSSRGTVIRWNFFHHMDNPSRCNEETSCIRQAIYIDDFEGGVNMTGNIFFRVPTGFFSNCGGDFIFANNLYVSVGVTVRQSGRSGDTFGSVAQTLWDQLHEVPFTGAVWVEHYPELALRFKDWNNGTSPPPNGASGPLNNLFELNAAVNITGTTPVPGEGPPSRFQDWTANAAGMFSLEASFYTPHLLPGRTAKYCELQ